MNWSRTSLQTYLRTCIYLSKQRKGGRLFSYDFLFYFVSSLMWSKKLQAFNKTKRTPKKLNFWMPIKSSLLQNDQKRKHMIYTKSSYCFSEDVFDTVHKVPWEVFGTKGSGFDWTGNEIIFEMWKCILWPLRLLLTFQKDISTKFVNSNIKVLIYRVYKHGAIL